MTQHCPACGSDQTSERADTSTFLYGVPDSVPLEVTQPVITCSACGESFTDYRGEDARAAVIERYRRAFAPPLSVRRRMVVVFGGRDFRGVAILNTALVLLHADHRFTHLLHGNADGADNIADRWARDNGVQPVSCDALWTYYRALNRVRAAGVIRNTRMVELEPEFGLCCPGGKGTADMFEQFKLYMKQRPSARLFQMQSSGHVDEVFS